MTSQTDRYPTRELCPFASLSSFVTLPMGFLHCPYSLVRRDLLSGFTVVLDSGSHLPKLFRSGSHLIAEQDSGLDFWFLHRRVLISHHLIRYIAQTVILLYMSSRILSRYLFCLFWCLRRHLCSIYVFLLFVIRRALSGAGGNRHTPLLRGCGIH